MTGTQEGGMEHLNQLTVSLNATGQGVHLGARLRKQARLPQLYARWHVAPPSDQLTALARG